MKKHGNALALVSPLFIISTLAATPVCADNASEADSASALALVEILASDESQKKATANLRLADVSGIVCRTPGDRDELTNWRDPADILPETAQTLTANPCDEKAIADLKQAADTGSATAQNALGFMFQKGLGVQQDLQEAAALYQRAADKGCALAQNNLGYLYFQGLGVQKNEPEAYRLFCLAAEKGEAHAQCNLGWMLQHGVGTQQDLQKAADLYDKAAQQHLAPALYNLSCLYQDGLGVEQDTGKTVELLVAADMAPHNFDNTLWARPQAPSQHRHRLRSVPAFAARPTITR